MRILVSLVATLCLLSACRGKDKTQAEGTAATTTAVAVIVSTQEIDLLKARLDALVAANVTATCERPVLRGGTMEGSAGQDMMTIMDLSGALVPCGQAVRAVSDKLEADLARLSSVKVPTTDRMQAIALACAPLPELLHRAVGHQDGCSPYLAGRHFIVSETAVFDALIAVAVLARSQAHDGQPLEAIELMLDFMRFGQDLNRGGSGLLYAMLSVAATKRLLPHLSAVLGVSSLRSKELEAIHGQVDILRASRVPPGEVFRGEFIVATLYSLRPGLEEPDWIPVGGMLPGVEPLPVKDAMDRQRLAVAWIANEELYETRLRACPETATWKSCIEQMDTMEAQIAEASKQLAGEGIEKLFAIASTPSPETMQATIRKPLIAVIKAVAAPSLVKYLRRMAWQEAALLALDAQITARLKACPAVPIPGKLGVPLETIELDGEYGIDTPALVRDDNAEAAPLLRYGCLR